MAESKNSKLGFNDLRVFNFVMISEKLLMFSWFCMFHELD